MKHIHQSFMRKALLLAKRGQGFVHPNPMVGAVIVKNEMIIAEGYHQKYGTSHAEIVALEQVDEALAEATMYVTLEPCSHYGKTPPCAEAIIQSGIKRVFVAMLDPNPLVSGRGIQLLKDAGIEVIVGVCEEEARELNKIFLKYMTTKMPYVLMKTAISLDGKIATQTGDSKWISGETSRNKVHELRHQLMGIMVGINTVLVDNPRLDCRLGEEVCQPTKIIVDSLLRIPTNALLWKNGNVIIATTRQSSLELRTKYEEAGVKVLVVGENQVCLKTLMKELGKLGIDSVLLEGGATLNASAIKAGIVDEVWTFVAPKIIGGLLAPTSVAGEGVEQMKDACQLHNMTYEVSGEDILIKGKVKK